MVRALPRFTPVIAPNCHGRSDGAESGLVRHISGFRGKWGRRGCCPPFGVQGGPVSSPFLQHWQETDKWKTWAGSRHTRKLWEILKQLKTKFYNGKYQQKLNISAAICTAYTQSTRCTSGAAKGSADTSSSKSPEVQHWWWDCDSLWQTELCSKLRNGTTSCVLDGCVCQNTVLL